MDLFSEYSYNYTAQLHDLTNHFEPAISSSEEKEEIGQDRSPAQTRAEKRRKERDYAAHPKKWQRQQLSSMNFIILLI